MGEKSNSCSGCFPFLSVKVLSKEKKEKRKALQIQVMKTLTEHHHVT